MSIYSQEKKFYVYQYLRKTDSKNGLAGTPYYIGKGSGLRYKKRDKFSIQKPKDLINLCIVAANLNEADAFQIEILLIFQYGRLDLKTGCLRNRTSGGEGGSGRIPNQASILKMVETRKVGGTFRRTVTSVRKQKLSRILNGTQNTNTPKGIAKSNATKYKNGTNKQTEETRKKIADTKQKRQFRHSPESIAKMVLVRKANGSYHRSLESIAKQQATRKSKKLANIV